MVNEQLQNAGRIAHDVGLATWFGGQVFGNVALNPSVALIPDPVVRGKVVNSAWFAFNPVGVAGLGAAAIVRVAARQTEQRTAKLTPAQQVLAQVEDGLLVTSILLTALTGLQSVRFAKSAPDGAVPVASGTEPTASTPEAAADLQRSIGALGKGTLLAGFGLLAVRSVQDRLASTRSAQRRALGPLGG